MDDDPTLPPADQEWPSDPPPTGAEDQAVLGWLAAHEQTPPLTSDLMLDALSAWHWRSPLPELTAEPKAGPECDRAQVLEQITDRLVQRLLVAHENEQARAALWEVVQRFGLVWRSFEDPDRAAQEALLRYSPPAWLLALEVAERDAAVDAAQAAAVRERRER